MTPSLSLLKLAAVAALALAAGLALFVLSQDRQSLPHRLWGQYVTSLERKLRNMFVTTPGQNIAIAQLAVAALLALVGLYVGVPFWWLILPLVALAPSWYIERMRRERVKEIESKMDGLILTLANALKATPNIGNALSYAQPLALAPMDDELQLVLKEMRVGNSVEQSLVNMSGRIQSAQLDAVLAGMLIGRQVGGDLPKILETTAATLREMARLQGILSAKTAEGKVQISVLAVGPVVLMVGFDSVRPGYFDPLTQSAAGWMLVVLAVALWISALVAARQILRVDL